MPRYRLTLEYDGSVFNGYQAQDGLPTVQGAVEAAILAFCGEAVRLQAAGRTDAGVHATGQVVHADLSRDWPRQTVMNAVNAHLVGAPVTVLACEIAGLADDGAPWHARFSARQRRYLYRILNRPAPPALERGRVWHVKKPLDVDLMNAAARHLIGHHDFTTFRDLACQAKSPMKTLDTAEASRVGEEVRLTFISRSFLHRQVRSMTGTLVEAGVGRWSAEDVKAALEARDRRACGPVAPACGLYLTGVGY